MPLDADKKGRANDDEAVKFGVRAQKKKIRALTPWYRARLAVRFARPFAVPSKISFGLA
jgi:hypothetical protein